MSAITHSITLYISFVQLVTDKIVKRWGIYLAAFGSCELRGQYALRLLLKFASIFIKVKSLFSIQNLLFLCLHTHYTNFEAHQSVQFSLSLLSWLRYSEKYQLCYVLLFQWFGTYIRTFRTFVNVTKHASKQANIKLHIVNSTDKF
jgi:hypothetical protein